MKNEYELMVFITQTTNLKYPDGIDSEPIMVGDALQVIRRLLRDDDEVGGYKLVKKTK